MEIGYFAARMASFAALATRNFTTRLELVPSRGHLASIFAARGSVESVEPASVFPGGNVDINTILSEAACPFTTLPNSGRSLPFDRTTRSTFVGSSIDREAIGVELFPKDGEPRGEVLEWNVPYWDQKTIRDANDPVKPWQVWN